MLSSADTVTILLPAPRQIREEPIWANDIHSQLNRTRLRAVVRPESIGALQETVHRASSDGRALSIAAGRHAMGGQQFGSDTVLVDLDRLSRIRELDPERGEIEVDAGIQWPKLVNYLVKEQRGATRQWGIIQKQTGADRLSIGGALAANAHGRGLRYRPMVGDVEAFTLVDARGELHRCSRSENPELFGLAIGGYGLFGIIASVRLRLSRRRKLERVVEIVDVEDLMPLLEERVASGCLYGDFQYATDLGSDDLLRKGVLSCYRPVDASTPIPEPQATLSERDWRELICLAHTDRKRAFDMYSSYYLSTSGQVYWSDTHQLSSYLDDYHTQLAGRLGALAHGTEMITEIFVPRDALCGFLSEVRTDFVNNGVELIYGTIRLIERDDETFLAWARERYVCVVFNLHLEHDRAGLDRAVRDFRRLIDRAISHGGSYFLTYHRWARRDQVLACYPQLPEFLGLKRTYDPQERFQSDWYRHYREMFGDRPRPPAR